jgi:DNA polymerase
MLQIVLDYETCYDQEYSLRKMTPVEYIFDPRFEVIGCAVKVGDEPAFWLTEQELRVYLAGLPEKVIVISHNALFDMSILAWKFDYIPTLMVDTLGMSRAWLGHKLRSLSLESVARYLGIGVKGGVVHQVKGMSLEAIKEAGFYDAYAAYSCNDAELCWLIYRKLIALGFPASEIPIMDMVLGCAVRPKFVLDQNLLAEHLAAVQSAKEELLQRVGFFTKEDLMSNDKLAAALRLLGVEPPMKTSPTTGKQAYAFARTDMDFTNLEEHENPDVQALVSARLGIKSTIEETRTQKFIRIAQLTWPGKLPGTVPMPLRYSGAHTHRLSGDWGMNVQNLPSRMNNKIRSSIKAPEGQVVVSVDASQIEARMASAFCGCNKLVTAFANKEDVYSDFASGVFGYPVAKATHKMERFTGKTAILGLQYGMGAPKFEWTVAMQSLAQLGTEVKLGAEVAAKTVMVYRIDYHEIPAMWRRLDGLITQMTSRDCHVQLGCLLFEFEKIRLPNGLYLYYNNLHFEAGQWTFTYGGKTKFLWGGTLLENIIQALARIQIMDAAIRVQKRIGTRLNLQVHDELIYVVPTNIARAVESVTIEEISRTPDWMPNVPLAAEGGIGLSYADAH